jgi:hypothetical protein
VSELGSLLRDGRLWRGPLPATLACLALLNAGIAAWRADLEQKRRENLLLQAPSSGKERPGPPRFDRSVGQDLGKDWSAIPDARRTHLVVLAGMSQMYAINEAEPGDQTIAEHLDDALAKEGTRVFGLAAPNLDNEEALLYLLATTSSPATKPDVFAYGLCFDKLRNVDLRPTLLAFVRSRPEVLASYRAACDGLEARFPMACEKLRATLETPVEKPAAEEHATVEGRIREAASVLPMVGAREDLNAEVQMRAFLLRNLVFQIEPSSKRPVIASRYALNQELLGLLIELAKRRGVTVVLYVIPLNPLAENPYVAEEHASFKRWAEDLAKAEGVPFDDLEDAVPTEHWGEFMGGPDFKHFKGAGHRITAAALLERFGPAIREATGRRPLP